MGDDQNVHVIICLSHLSNLLFKEFAKNVHFHVRKRKLRYENDVTSFNLTSHFCAATLSNEGMITSCHSKYMISSYQPACADNHKAGITLPHMQTDGYYWKYRSKYVITVNIVPRCDIEGRELASVHRYLNEGQYSPISVQ